MAIAEFFEKNLGKYIFILPQQSFTETNDEVPVALSQTEYDESQQVIYRLSATENFKKAETATVTNNPVSSGGNVSDHYRWTETTINFTGVISDSPVGYVDYISSLPSSEDETKTIVTEYIRGLKALVRGTNKTSDNKKGSPLVTIYLPDGNGEENCVITSLNISRDNKISNGYRVDVTAKKVQAAISTVRDVVISAEYAKETKTDSAPVEKSVDPSADRFEFPR